MEIKEIVDGMKNLDTKVTEKLKNIEEKMKEGNFATPEQINEVKQLVEAANAANGETRKSLEEVETKFKKAQAEKKAVEVNTVQKAIAHEIMEKKELFHERMGNIGKAFDIKSPAVMTFGSSATGKPSIDLRTDIIEPIRRRTHVRQLLPMGQTSAQLYQYIQETNESQEGAAAGQTEGSDKAFLQFKIDQKDAKVETLAAFVRVSRQMLDDVVGLSSYLSRRLPEEILVREDLELLNGTGSSPFTFTGIAENAQDTPAYGATLEPPNNGMCYFVPLPSKRPTTTM